MYWCQLDKCRLELYDIYPAVRSIGRDTKCTVLFFFLCMYGYEFLSRGFTDQREILHGGPATSQTGFLPFWGIDPGMAKFWASAGGRMSVYTSR